MSNGLEIFSQGVISQNIILFQGLGIYALIRYTKDINTALRAAIAMLATMLTANTVLWAVESVLPISFGLHLPVLFLIALVSALLWQRVLGKQWFNEMGGFVPSGFINSGLVGVLLSLPSEEVVGAMGLVYGLSAAVGYGLVLVVMAGVRTRMNLAPIPKPLRGIPILLIAAGLLALGLMGFRF